MPEILPVFDGHNDFLLRLLENPKDKNTIWLKGDGKGHLDLPRMKLGNFAGGFFAIYIPPETTKKALNASNVPDRSPYDLPLPAEIERVSALPTAIAMASDLIWMERVSKGQFKVCKSASDIRECISSGIIAAIMHMEGAEPIGENLDDLHLWHSMGLRSLGPVWSRPTIFGNGVPFRFPSSPDTGDGLTEAGKTLISECNTLKIMVDLSHLNEKGFNDVARISSAPLVATHSNAHVICESSRNLTDRQLDMIAESNGMVGLNYGCGFLRPDGSKNPNIGWDIIMRHLDHLLLHLGENRVGLGSDFDGTTIPNLIGNVTGLNSLQDAMRAHGYGSDLLRKICYKNWLDLLERTL